MARRKFIISSKLKIKNDDAIGVILSSKTESLRNFKSLYKDKKVFITNNENNEEGIITSFDGYLSNTNIDLINLFFIIKTDNIDKFNKGDTVEIYIK